MNLKESLEYLVGLGKSSAKIESLRTGRRQTTFVLPDEKTVTVDHWEVDRDESLYTLDSLMAWLANHSELTERSIWVGEEGVKVVFDPKYRDDVATLVLEDSEEFQALGSLPRKFSQKSLRFFLRSTFDAGGDVEKVLEAIKTVDFSRQSDGTSTVEHGRESLGKSVEAKVQGATEIPERFTVECARWATDGLRMKVPISLMLDVDFQDECFVLKPGPNELNKFHCAAVSHLVSLLRNDQTSTPVYHGSP